MSERKQKRESENLVELDTEETGFLLEPTQVEVGSGYTLAVNYDEDDKPIIDVKTYGQVDLVQLRRDIERMFPNAQIRQMNQTHTVTIVKRNKKKPKPRKK